MQLKFSILFFVILEIKIKLMSKTYLLEILF